MRIGNHEVTVSTLIHAAVIGALTLALLLVATRTYSSVREAWQRGAILASLSESADSTNTVALEQGIVACNALIAADPARSAPLLYKGCIYSKLGNHAEAKSAFEQAAAASKATLEEKSIALAAASSEAALDGGKDGRPAHLDDALKLAQKALEVSATPDALATEAVLKSWQDSISDAQLEALVDKALAASPAPAAANLEQLYRLKSALLLRAKKPNEARDGVARVKAINPFNTQVGEVGRNAQLSAILDTSLDPAARRAQIESVSANVNSFGARRVEALQAVAMAWHSFSSAPDYLASDGPFAKARAVLNQLIQANPKDFRAPRLLAAMLEERIDLTVKELSAPFSGLNGESPHASAWDDASKKAEEISKDDLERLTRIRQYASEEENVWQRVVDQASDKKERVEAKTRQLLAMRRQVWSTRVADAAWRESLINKAVAVAGELAALDGSGKGHWLLSLTQIEKGNLGAAFTALSEARKRGYKTPEVEKLFASFQTSSELVDFGPAPNERQFGAAQVIRATLKIPEAATLSNVRLEIDGKDAVKTLVGNQVFSVLDDSGMTGAAHKVKISADAGPGMSLSFPEFTLNIDKDPPVWKLTPAPGTEIKTQVWQVDLKDATGVDWGKLNAGLRAVKTQSAVISDMRLIKDGRYVRTIASIKAKSGDPVVASPFGIAPPNDLPPGEYKIWIDVPDTVGNRLKDEKVFTIK